jgi:hypothetical protein
VRSKTHFVSFAKPPFRIEVAVTGPHSKHEARTIAERELAGLNGYQFMGVN